MRRILLILAATLVLVLIGLRIYLSTGATTKVAERLSTMLGAPVQVDDVDIPFFGETSFEGLRIFERDIASEQPWLVVAQGQTDIAAPDLLGSASPSRVTLHQAEVTLRFDTGGHLLTKLPQPEKSDAAMPQIFLKNATVTLAQEGREPMVIHGLDAEASELGKAISAKGHMEDPYWGKWTVQADFATETGRLDLHLVADQIEFTPEKLTRIAFVSEDVWEQVRVEGTTGIDFTLRTSLEGEGTHYRVALDVQQARIDVPAIDLNAYESSGQVVVEDELVTFENVQGKTAGGAIRTTGKLDFRPQTSKLNFAIGLDGVELKGLPKSWNLPEALAGKLSGAADLEVELDEGVVRTNGQGKGVIDQGQWGKFEFPEPVPLLLHADGAKFNFAPRLPNMNLGAWLPGSRLFQIRR